jgi:hypothetical protein
MAAPDWGSILAKAGIPESPGRAEAVKAAQDHQLVKAALEQERRQEKAAGGKRASGKRV